MSERPGGEQAHPSSGSNRSLSRPPSPLQRLASALLWLGKAITKFWRESTQDSFTTRASGHMGRARSRCEPRLGIHMRVRALESGGCCPEGPAQHRTPPSTAGACAAHTASFVECHRLSSLVAHALAAAFCNRIRYSSPVLRRKGRAARAS